MKYVYVIYIQIGIPLWVITVNANVLAPEGAAIEVWLEQQYGYYFVRFMANH